MMTSRLSASLVGCFPEILGSIKSKLIPQQWERASSKVNAIPFSLLTGPFSTASRPDAPDPGSTPSSSQALLLSACHPL